jgi:hypothetical protein
MSEATTPKSASPPPSPVKRNYGWLYFFIFVTVASVSVMIFMIWFNLRIQLKPEQLDEAHERWKANGPKNYDMVCKKRLNDNGKEDKFEVEVRGGLVKRVRMNGSELEKETGAETDPRIYHSMDQVYRDITRFMDLDTKPGATRVYVIANFDPDTGAVRHYVRRVMGTRQRIEMTITLKTVP